MPETAFFVRRTIMRILSLQTIRLKYLMFVAVLIFLIMFVIRIKTTMEKTYIGYDGRTNQIHLLSFNKTMNDVLLIGYVMGGTVFPAEVLGMRSGHFYVHQPLHKIAKYQYFRPGLVCSMMDMRCNATNVADVEALGVVKAVYQCDNTRYRGHLRMWQLRKLIGDQSSWQENLEEHCGNTQNVDCRGRLLSQCSHSVSKVVNTPRLSLSLASRLLQQLPNLKIIHILRDPRAIMYAYLRAKWPFHSGKLNTSRSLCQRLKDDLADSALIKKAHPGRILTVFHEHLATSPEQTMQKIFDFVGYPGYDDGVMQKKFQEFFHGNSTLSAGLWRKHAPWSVISVTNNACANRYRSLGLPGFVNRQDLSNNSIPLLLPISYITSNRLKKSGFGKE
ncbi:carbohydrate sulfotransferase 1-like [Pecten maximus]|uniref:carbohydrate sulfotransferase 1-like n=1 Tax=Pecten maximus TaxID=6579 RepID=UPI001457F142|nr:carbohydrate sulfotransferase 1-like [Pecten maximus]